MRWTRAAPAKAIGLSCQPQRDCSIAEQREGQEQSWLGFAQSEPGQIENQDYGESAVGKQPDESREEEKPHISAENSQHAVVRENRLRNNSRYNLSSDLRRLVCTRLTGISVCFLSSIRIW